MTDAVERHSAAAGGAPRSTTRAVPAGEADYLAAYDPSVYPPVAVTADIVVLTVRNGRLAVLLIERAGHPFQGCWALPGGFVEAGEDVDAAASRELHEETGLRLVVAGPAGGSKAGRGHGGQAGHLEQLRTYGAPDRDPRLQVISVAYVAMVADAPAPTAGSDAAVARYWLVEDLALPAFGQHHGAALAFDHATILVDAVERVRAKLEYSTLATAFVDEPFTLGELRRVYEAVWGESVHEANFRRKVLSTSGFVEPTGSTAPTEGRPAQLYRRGDATVLHPPLLR